MSEKWIDEPTTCAIWVDLRVSCKQETWVMSRLLSLFKEMFDTRTNLCVGGGGIGISQNILI